MSIQGLKSAAEYQSERRSAFPSAAALAWFERRHRTALNIAGALVIVNRRLLIVPDKFDAVVLQVGAQLAEEAR